MGQTQSTQMKETLRIASDMVFDTVAKVNQTCQNTGELDQKQVVELGISDEMYKYCLDRMAAIEGAGFDPKKCMASGIRAEDIKQSLDFKLSSTCQFNNEFISQLQSQLAGEMNKKVNEETDAFGKAISDLASNLSTIGGNSETKVDKEAIISNTIKQSFTLDATQQMINSYVARQNQHIAIKNATDSTVKGVYQDLRMEVVSALLGANAQLAQAAAKTDAKYVQEETKKLKGVTDIVDSVTGMIGGMAQSYVIVAVACVCCCLLVLGGLAFLLFRGDGAGGKPGFAAAAKRLKTVSAAAASLQKAAGPGAMAGAGKAAALLR